MKYDTTHWRSSEDYQLDLVKRCFVRLALYLGLLVIACFLPWSTAVLLSLASYFALEAASFRMTTRLYKADLDIIESHRELVAIMHEHGLARPKLVPEEPRE
jgi:hypothetical protein